MHSSLFLWDAGSVHTRNFHVLVFLRAPKNILHRSCLGAKFAQVEGTIALAMLARAYHIALPPDCNDRKFLFEKMALLTAQPKNVVNLILTKRK